MMPIAADDVHRWVAPLGWAIVHFAWQGLAVALVVWASMTLARTPRARYALGCVAMIAMLALPVVTLAWIGPDARRVEPTTNDASRFADEPIYRPADVATRERRASSPARRDVPVRDRVAAATPALVAIWLAGVALVATWHALGLVQLTTLRGRATAMVAPLWLDRVRTLSARLNVRRRVALLLTDRLDCPAVVGAIRPAILWPLAAMSGLTPMQVEALLAHELAHVRRHDYAVNLLQTLVETLLFYHPAVWWLSRRVRQEREHCCDDLAASAIGDRATYAGALAAMESLRQSPAFVLSADGGSLVVRVRRLLAPASPRRFGPVGVGLIFTTLVLVGTFACKPREPAALTTAKPATTQTFDDRIAVGDLLRVSIGELEASGKTTHVFKRVANDGTITLPYFKIPFDLHGMTTAQAERRIADAYGKAAIIADANVGVLVVQGADGRSVPTGLFTPDEVDAAKPQATEASGRMELQRAIAELAAQVKTLQESPRPLPAAVPLLVPSSQASADALLTEEQRQQIASDLSLQRLEAQVDALTLQRNLMRESQGPEAALTKQAEQLLAAEVARLTARRQTIVDQTAPLAKIRNLQLQRQQFVDALATATHDHGETSDDALAVRGLLWQLDQQIATATGMVGEYYISGAVARPGVYSVTGRKITLMQALTSAGCAAPAVPDSEPAHDFGIDVVRRDPVTAKETRTRYQWSDVTHGKLATFYLLPNDQIFVGVGGATTAPATTQATSD